MATQQASENTVLSCPMCKSHAPADYSLVGYGSQPPGGVTRFAVLRCRRHGVEFADALPPKQEPEAEAKVDHLVGLYGEDPNESSPRYVEFMDRVESITGPSNGGVLHDVGCGMGHLLVEARRRGWQVQGSDIAPGVKLGIEKNGIRCMIGGLSELNIPSESCDVVTSFCVLPHHLTEPTRDMLAVRRILKPGGWFVMQFPDNGPFRIASKITYRVFGDAPISHRLMANLYGPGGHQFAYTRKNLGEYLRLCGFKDLTFQSYSGPPECTLARFHRAPFWCRASAALAVYALKFTGDILGIPNHSIVFTRKA